MISRDRMFAIMTAHIFQYISISLSFLLFFNFIFDNFMSLDLSPSTHPVFSRFKLAIHPNIGAYEHLSFFLFESVCQVLFGFPLKFFFFLLPFFLSSDMSDKEGLCGYLWGWLCVMNTAVNLISCFCTLPLD